MAIYTGIADVGVVLGGPLFGFVLEVADYTELYMGIAGFILLGLAVFLPWDARVRHIGFDSPGRDDGQPE